MSNRIEQAGRTRFGWIVSSQFLCGTSLAALVLIALPAAVQAQQDKTWDANGAVAGLRAVRARGTRARVTWRDSVGLTVWDNSLLDSAIFGGTVGTVTLGGPITVQNITFTLGGYTVTGNTLTLAGLAPAVGLHGRHDNHRFGDCRRRGTDYDRSWLAHPQWRRQLLERLDAHRHRHRFAHQQCQHL